MKSTINNIQARFRLPQDIPDHALHKAHMLYGLVMLSVVVLSVLLIYALVNPPPPDLEFKSVLIILLLCQLPAIHQLRKQKWDRVIFLQIVPLWVVISYGATIEAGFYATVTMLYIIPLIISAVLLDIRATVILMVLTLLYMFILMMLEMSGYVSYPIDKVFIFRFIIVSVVFFTVVATLHYSKHKLAEAESKNRQLYLKNEIARIQNTYSRSLSHDLRTPLTVLNTQIHLISKRLERNMSVDENLHKMDSYIRHLIQIIEDFDQMTRLYDVGIPNDEWQLVSLGPLIEEVIESCSNYSTQKNIRLTFNNKCDHTDIVFGDKRYLWHMLKQLIQNSIEYGNQDGETVIDLHPDSNTFRVAVTDNGMGMMPKQLDQIFKPFYRGNTARTVDLNSGTGIGLTIAERIVQLHQGSIRVESEPGKGCTFEVVLPSPKQRLEN